MKGIRGHHLFCTALFSGHGYDAAFTANMQKLIAGLQNGEPLRLADGQDAVCACCPNRMPDGGCALGTEDVARRDRAALQVLRLKPGQQTDWQSVGERLRAVTGPEFAAVCGGCRWAREGLCSWALLQARLPSTPCQ